MKKMALTIPIVSIVLVGLAVLTFGHFRYGFAHSGPQGREHFVEKVTQELQLDPQQQVQLEQFVTRLHEKRASGWEFRQAVRTDLMAALQQDQLDRGELDRIYMEAKEKLDTVYDLFATELVDFHQTLTPDQRDTLIARIEDHRHRRGPFSGHGCRWRD